MTRREKLIVIATAVVGGVAVFPYLMPSDSAAPVAQPQTLDTAQIAQLGSRVAVSGLSEEQAALLEWVEGGMGTDPFADEAVPIENEAPEAETYSYTAYFGIGARVIAVVNGRAYREGDGHPEGQFSVLKIAREAVELQQSGSGETLTIEMQEIQ